MGMCRALLHDLGEDEGASLGIRKSKKNFSKRACCQGQELRRGKVQLSQSLLNRPVGRATFPVSVLKYL